MLMQQQKFLALNLEMFGARASDDLHLFMFQQNKNNSVLL